MVQRLDLKKRDFQRVFKFFNTKRQIYTLQMKKYYSQFCTHDG